MDCQTDFDPFTQRYTPVGTPLAFPKLIHRLSPKPPGWKNYTRFNENDSSPITVLRLRENRVFAIKLAQALNTEIISLIHVNFTKKCLFGTAVPEPEELAEAKHHFIQHISIFNRIM